MTASRTPSRAAQIAAERAGPGRTRAVIGALIVTLALAACSRGDRPTHEPPRHAAGAPAPGAEASAPTPGPSATAPLPAPAVLPPLPPGTFPSARPPEVVLAAYEFAARHPEVLRHVPCFCGCERSGHADNEDCFVKSRAGDGQVTWDAHGAT